MATLAVTTQTTVSVTPREDGATRGGVWECGGRRGSIWLAAGGGYVADSPALLVGGREPGAATMDDAARIAYRRDVVLAPALDAVRRAHRIEFPAEDVAVYAVTDNDPTAAPDGEVDEDARPTGLTPWERLAVRTARENRSASIMVRAGEKGDRVTLFAVAGRHVVVVRSENGEVVGRWRVLDGSRKAPLFLA